MRPKNMLMALSVLLCVSVAVSLSAQTSGQVTGQPTSAPPEEHKIGDYVAAGSIEAGYRFVDVSGATFPCQSLGKIGQTCNFTGMWETFEALRQGPRVFSQSLSLRNVGQTGVLFDNLFVSSFGWGGDPEQVARVRVNKNKIYDFTALYRQSYSRFNMNVLANPLNPPTSTPNVPIYNSTHVFDTARRMSDVNLTLFPVSPVTFHVGYNRVRIEDPANSTLHLGTEVNLLQMWNVTNNQGRAGFDLKFIPRTTLSFNAVVNWLKNDSTFTDPFLFWNIAGIPADLGVSWNTLGGAPCGAAAVGTPACNLAFSAFRQDRVRTTMPTVFASLESHYWNKFDLRAKFTYGWADLSSVYDQFWNGWITRNRERQQSVLNTPKNNRISNEGDFGITYHVTDRFRISDTFHYVNEKMPLFANSLTTDWLAPAGSNALTPLPVPAVTAVAVVNGLFHNERSNETDFEFDFARYGGLTIGYRYTRHYITFTGAGFDIDANTLERTSPVEPGEIGYDHFRIPQHTAIGGLWIQPSDKFRLNFDAEASSAGVSYTTPDANGVPTTFNGDTTFTRIYPRHQQQYRARATFKPMLHVVMTGSANIIEQRNTLSDINYHMHNRNYGFNADISPSDRLLLDVGYNYQDYLQSDFVCFVGPSTAAGAYPGPAFAAATTCLTDPTYLTVNGRYASQAHFGDVMLRAKPVKRVTLSAGYSIVHTDGSSPLTYAFIPISPLQYTYHRPLAALEIEIAGGLALKGGFNYYDYNERGTSDLIPYSGGATAPRNFHANTGTIALRYSF